MNFLFCFVDKFLVMEDLSGKNVIEKEEKDCYVIVGNILKEFYFFDLWVMFFNFINDELKGFKCFYFCYCFEFRYEVGLSGEDKEIKMFLIMCCVIFILKINF